MRERAWVRAVNVGALGALGLFFAAGRPARAAGGDRTACGLWRGTIGKSEVAVVLSEAGTATPGAWSGRYAYLHIGKAILLAGARAGAGLSLEERGGAGGKPSGRWILSPGASGHGPVQEPGRGGDGWTGTWSSPDGKRSAPVTLACLGDGAGKLRDPWLAANLGGRTADEQFDAFVRNPEVPGKVRDGVEGTSVRAITMLSTKAEYELVERHPSPKAAVAINAVIRDRVARARKEEKDCRAEGLTCEITATITIPFLSPRFATVSVAGYYDGGGAHPDSDLEISVYELTEGGATRYEVDKVYDLRAKGGAWKPAFEKLVRAVAKRRGVSDPSLDDCPDELEDAKVQLGLALGGIDVDVSYTSHAIAACGYSVLLKAEKLARFLRPDAPQVFHTGKF